jgi:nitroreductase
MTIRTQLSKATDRQPEYPADRLFIDRWSARAFTGEPISELDLFTAFEAARWAPSSLNFQPWRFVFAHCDSPRFAEFLSLLAERNQLWAHKASALIFVLSDTMITYNDREFSSPSHAFDTGAAWSNFAHQAHLLGYSTRAIGGFDRQAAPELLGVPERFDIIAGIAIGVPDQADTLPETLQPLEKPSRRHSLNTLVFEDRFGSI